MKTYSHHTFYFPFVWDDGGKLSMRRFISKLSDGWEDISVTGFGNDTDKAEADYQTLQYFTPSARRSLFGWDTDYVKWFSYKGTKGGKYRITKGDTRYILDLKGVKLKVFNTGIGILYFETQNNDYRTIESVKDINEYGRRIYAPFFSSFDGSCGLCADSLGVKFEGVSISDPISTFKPLKGEEYIPSFIKFFLPKCKISPAIDDRMFVTCLVNDAEKFVEYMDYNSDSKVSESLYELIFIDKDGSCSCPTESMRRNLLDSSLYLRWFDYKYEGAPSGTIHAITNFSWVCITAAGVDYAVETPFLTQYSHMVTAVLAQRATILAFDEKVSLRSRRFGKKNIRLGGSHIKKLKHLQESYIAFLNQHMNIEITCQEQGIDLYRMLQDKMFIANEEQMLSRELDLLSDTANIAGDIRLNRWALGFSIIFGLITVIDLMINFLTFLLQ